MRHRGPCLQLFYLNFALRGGTEFDVLKENVLTCFKITKSEKKKTNFSSNIVPVGLDFIDAGDPLPWLLCIYLKLPVK